MKKLSANQTYASIINEAKPRKITVTPPNRKLKGLKTKQVLNNAGAFVFSTTETQQLDRFLMCGSMDGTFYVTPQKLTEQNCQTILKLINKNGVVALRRTLDLVLANRMVKIQPALFVFALGIKHGDESTKKFAYDHISSLCKTSTQLFGLLNELKGLGKGWSSGLRRGVAEWYLTRDMDTLAYQILKYRQRDGWTHLDAIRLSHPNPDLSPHQNLSGIFAYIKLVDQDSKKQFKIVPKDCPLILAYEAAKTATGKKLTALITESKLTWEMVPTEQLNKPEVLEALLPSMPLMALIRNLNRYSKAGLTAKYHECMSLIYSKLTNPTEVSRSGIHPIFVMNSLSTYSKGRGVKGSGTWDVSPEVIEALEKCFVLSFKNATQTNANILVGIDVSGSMSEKAAGTNMTCSQVGNLVGAITLKAEPKADLIHFDTSYFSPGYNKNSSLTSILNWPSNGGGTDCGQVFKYALDRRKKYDGIVIYTDSETWAGKRHALEWLSEYRQKINPNVKVIEVAMASNPRTLLPQNDPNVLRIVGFDASVHKLITEFLK